MSDVSQQLTTWAFPLTLIAGVALGHCLARTQTVPTAGLRRLNLAMFLAGSVAATALLEHAFA